jgi:predicted DNA-binding transcriptional regulator YafY
LETLLVTLELLKRIPRSPRKTSTPDLARQLKAAGFDRDERTVQRQLKEMAGHFDIECDDRNKPYGYQWKRDAVGLSVPGLTEKESLVLALAEDHLKALLPPVVMESMEPFFHQARARLAPHPEQGPDQRSAAEWVRKVRVVRSSQPLLAPKVDPLVFEAVSRALWRDEWLDIVYTNSVGRTTQGRVMPLGLAQQGERLYLVGRFEGHQDDRILAVHRIESAAETGFRFVRPPEFDLETYDDQGRFAFGKGTLIDVEFVVRKEAGLHLLESRLSENQQVHEEDGCYRIHARIAETQRLKWWLRGFGEDVTVIAPEALALAVHPHRMKEAA